MQAREKKPDESLKYYVAILVEIANHAPAISEQDVVDAIINGLRDNSKNVSILYGAKTIAELKESLKRFDHLSRAQVTEFGQSKGAISNQGQSVVRTVANTVASAKPAASVSASNVDMATVRF